MAEKGRPKETPPVQLDKWTREFCEVPTKPELGWKMNWYYDKSKNTSLLSYLMTIANNAYIDIYRKSYKKYER